MKTEHTPLPWSVGGNLPYVVAVTAPEYRGRIPETTICRGQHTGGQNWPYLDPMEYRANAAFIVKACNSHYELLEALKDIKVAAYRAISMEVYVDAMHDALDKIFSDAQAAISKAEGEQDAD